MKQSIEHILRFSHIFLKYKNKNKFFYLNVNNGKNVPLCFKVKEKQKILNTLKASGSKDRRSWSYPGPNRRYDSEGSNPRPHENMFRCS